jgi:hypothetical protein
MSDLSDSGSLPWYERTSFWGLVGAALAVLLVVLAAALKDLRWLLIFSWVLSCASLWLFAVTRTRTRTTVILGTILLALLHAALYFSLSPNTDTGSDAMGPRLLRGSSLGNPVEPIKKSSATYQAVYDRANVIWLEPFLAFYVLPNDPKQKWINQPDRLWIVSSKEVDLRKEFRPPANRNPPYGGIIDQWRAAPERWKWMGFIEWHCIFGASQISYQRYEKGIVVGPFHIVEAKNKGRLFLIKDDGTWSQESTDQLVGACTEPDYG